ncbi:MAG: hypothetical protein O7H41_15885 [Planctomycetota bacterium]|nr:hypothetical protein [Planctomycetota bacterium]
MTRYPILNHGVLRVAAVGLLLSGCSWKGSDRKNPVGTPTGVSATAGCSEAFISWAPVTGATSYILYWSTTSQVTKATGTQITGVTSPYTHVGLSNGTTYYYVVTAMIAQVESAESSEGMAAPIALGAPIGVSATDTGCRTITIDWSPVPSATTYDIYWATNSGVTRATGTPITGVIPPYVHTGLSVGTTHYYVVIALSAFCESPESTEVSAAATPVVQGILDTTFGTGGVAVHDAAAGGGGGGDTGLGIVPDASGRILVTGYSSNGVRSDMALWRYTSGGALDSTFGTGGVAVHFNAAGGAGHDSGNAIAVDALGRILVAGSSDSDPTLANEYDMALWRYTSDGMLDTSFGSGGVVVHGNAAGGGGNDGGSAIVLDASGGILVVGASDGDPSIVYGFDMTIWRYTSGGTLDPTFGTGGVAIHDSAAGGGGDDFGSAVALDAVGRILVGGTSSNGIDSDMAIWRYTSDGMLDTSFGSSGVAVHDSAAGGGGHDYSYGIALDAVGRILVGGTSSSGNDYDMAIWRYTSDGMLDASFGTGGVAVHDGAGGWAGGRESGRAIALDAAGRILVTGHGSDDMVIWRYTSGGTLDTTFGSGGVVAHDSAAGGGWGDRGLAIALDGCGLILVAGESYNGTDADMVIWRYE